MPHPDTEFRSLDSAWKRAILLVAGKGERLQPHTHTMPKPLTEVAGVPILQNALWRLAEAGVEHVTLVTGYLHGALMGFAKENAFGMELQEIYNADFAETNNMYSLWLARDELERGCLLLEGDVFFAGDVLPELREMNPERSYWFGDDFSRYGDGCMLRADDRGRILELEIVRGAAPENLHNCFKSAGILALTAETGRKFSRWLGEDVERGRVDVYYDLVLADHLPEVEIDILNIAGKKWLEIDDVEDLRRAEALFGR